MNGRQMPPFSFINIQFSQNIEANTVLVFLKEPLSLTDQRFSRLHQYVFEV